MLLKRFICLILCLAFLSALGLSAAADDGEDALSPILDQEYLQQMTEDFISDHHVKEGNLSVGFIYTATGDTWLYNEDEWYYSASLYKVPLMMIFAEREAAGELTLESNIDGLTLAQAYEYILTHSSNDYGHLMMDHLGGDRAARLLYQNYSELPKDDYDPDFYDYSYFTARFMTDVMRHLYFENERFPNVLESLMHAQDDRHFEYGVKDYEIAQKYGAYNEFYHNAAVIYTPNPIILVVMTKDASGIDGLFGDYASIMVRYALSLDEKLAERQKAIEEQEKREAEEKARLEEEEKARLEEEERQRQAEEAQRKAEEQRLQQEAEEKAAARKKLSMKAVAAAAVLGVLATVVLAVRSMLRKAAEKRRRQAEARKKRSKSSGYTPKH